MRPSRKTRRSDLWGLISVTATAHPQQPDATARRTRRGRPGAVRPRPDPAPGADSPGRIRAPPRKRPAASPGTRARPRPADPGTPAAPGADADGLGDLRPRPDPARADPATAAAGQAPAGVAQYEPALSTIQRSPLNPRSCALPHPLSPIPARGSSLPSAWHDGLTRSNGLSHSPMEIDGAQPANRDPATSSPLVTERDPAAAAAGRAPAGGAQSLQLKIPIHSSVGAQE
jgi:hypothetical protein